MENFLQLAEEQIRQEQRFTERRINRWSKYFGEFTDKEGNTLPAIPRKDPRSGQDLWALCAHMFENQVAFNPTLEATRSAAVSIPNDWSLPIIRQIFPYTILSKIALVQPMARESGGTANVFYWKFLRTDDSSYLTDSDGYSDYSTVASETTVPRQLEAEMTSTTITAERKILSAVYSQTVAEDLSNVMGLNMQTEMYRAMQRAMVDEYEQTGLLTIYNGATAGTVSWDATVPSGLRPDEHYQSLYHALIDAERYIRRTYYRACNYVVGGLKFVDYLRKSNHFNTAPDLKDPSLRVSSGVTYEGNFMGHWDVYSTPFMNDLAAFTSFYPTDTTHGGAVWAPYIPMMQMPPLYAEAQTRDDGGEYRNTDHWTQHIRTRQAFSLLCPDMFAKITITE